LYSPFTMGLPSNLVLKAPLVKKTGTQNVVPAIKQLNKGPSKLDDAMAIDSPKVAMASGSLSAGGSSTSALGKRKLPPANNSPLTTSKHSPDSRPGSTLFASVVARDQSSGPQYQLLRFLVKDLTATISKLDGNLRDDVLTEKFQFHGSYSIVADPNVDNRKRVSLVVQEFRKTGKLRFSAAAIKHASSITESFKIYHCHCSHGKVSSASTKGKERAVEEMPTSLSTSLSKSGKGTVKDWLDKAGDVPSTLNVCGGIVKILVQNDRSHPLDDIVGQKITILVRHPNEGM